MLKDWIPLLAAGVSFVGGLLGAGLGSFSSGQTERLKLLRVERLKATADLLTACRAAVRAWDMYRRLEAAQGNLSMVVNPERFRQEADQRFAEVAADRNKAMNDAWKAYHVVRLLGPASLITAAHEYWQVFEELSVSSGASSVE